MTFWTKWVAVLAAPLLLTGCLLAPGKFISTMEINADRSFTFTYVGEVHALNMDGIGDMMKGGDDDASDDGNGEGNADADDAMSDEPNMLWQNDGFAKLSVGNVPSDDSKAAQNEEQKKALAETLSKEAGYRKVEYRGNDVFFVDYAISGRLDHAFVFPYNLDGELIFPFVVAEIRANGTVRVKAPAFAKSASRGDMSGMGKPNDKIDGTFTLTTDAEVISQNNEDGARTAAGKKTITWRITPATADAPTAVLRMTP